MTKTLQPAIDGIPFVKPDGTLTQYGHTLISQNNNVTKTINTELSDVKTTVSNLVNATSRTYTFSDITLSTVGNIASWSDGFVTKTLDGVSTTTSITAGSVEWTGTDIFIYYDEETGFLESTDDLIIAQGTKFRQVVATYKGDDDLIDGLYAPIIDGNRILAGQIGANQLIAGEVITSSAQIGNAVIASANIADAAIESAKIGDLQVERIKIANGAVSDSAAFSVFPAGGFVMDDITDNITFKNTPGAELNLLGDRIAYGNGLFVRVGDENTVGTSSDGITWITRTLPSNLWTDIIFANGTFVAVGQNGKIITSDDAVTWTLQSAGVTDQFSRIQYGNGEFIVTGNNMFTSPDGVVWTESDTGATNPDSVTYGAGRYVAIDNDSIISSPDGVIWTDVTPGGGPYTFYDITFGNSVFVIVGTSGSSFTSPDGITWTARTTPVSPATSWFNIKFVANTFFAFNYNTNDAIIKSTDGITWSPYGGSVGNRFNDIAEGGGRVVAVNQGPSFPNTVHSDNLTSWTLTTNLSAKTSVVGQVIAYGGGIYVALDRDNNTVPRSFRSTDGINWTNITTPATDITCLIYGAGLFVAAKAGTNTVYTSPDGITWTGRTSPAGNWKSISWNGTVFVVVGDAGAVMTSTDGITWTARTAAAANNWTSVTWGNSLFVAVSNTGTGNRVMTSPTGTTWTSRTSASDSAWNDLVWGAGLFVAVWDGGTMTSSDGITWATGSSFGAGDNIEFNGTLFVSVRLNTVATSSNGTSWTERLTPGYQVTQTAHQLAVGASNSFIIFEDFGDILTSPDGITWTKPDINLTNNYTSIAFGNGRFVAISSDGLNRVLTSEDALFWTVRAQSQSNSWNSVAFGNGVFVAVSSDGTNRVMTSPDGITWTNRTASQANSWRSVCYGTPSGTPRFVAVSSDGTNRVMTSSDGITWTNQTASQANSWRSVCWNGSNQFVAVSSDGTNRVMTSSDGITWTNQTAAAAVEWRSVVSNGSLYVAVANTGTAAQRIMTSSNGTTWTSRTAPSDNNWVSVTAGGGLFVAVSSNGTNRVMSSTDGITWTARTINGNNTWSAVTFANGLYVAISSSGLSATSIALIDTFSTDYTEFFDRVRYNIGTGAACPARLIIEPGLYGSADTFIVNSPTANGTYTTRFITEFILYKYDNHDYTGTPTIIATRGQKSLEYEWRNQVLARAIGADQVESLVSPFILNKDVDYVEGNGLALAMQYSSYSSNPLQASIIRSTPGFGFIWSAFYK